MVPPSEPVTLTAEQVAELTRQFADMRHDVNNHLSLILAAVDLIRRKPQIAERMIATVSEQPSRINETIAVFSREFEATFGITHPSTPSQSSAMH